MRQMARVEADRVDLLAMGRPHEIAHGSLRLTLGRDNTAAHVDTVLEVLPRVIEQLRALSPVYQPGALQAVMRGTGNGPTR